MGIPVRVFKNTDKDAPQITGKRGDLKVVLKACLANGYGSGDNYTKPLGWEIVKGTESADGFECAFRQQAEDSAKNIIKVVCTDTIYADLYAYFDTDLSGNLINGSSKLTGQPTWERDGVDWYVIGHGKSFLFVVRGRGAAHNMDDKGGQSRAFFFGEIGDNIGNPRGNTLLWRSCSADRFALTSSVSNTLNSYFARANNRISLAADGKVYWTSVDSGYQMEEMSYGYSTINGNMYFSKVAMYESGELRGFWPFGFLVHHKLKTPDNFSIKNIDGVDYLLALCGAGSRETNLHGCAMPILINLKEWDF